MVKCSYHGCDITICGCDVRPVQIPAVKEGRNLCNCPNCQTDNCPAGKVDAAGLALAEYEYWKEVADDGRFGANGIEGMGAAANIHAAILLGLTVEEFKKKKEK